MTRAIDSRPCSYEGAHLGGCVAAAGGLSKREKRWADGGAELNKRAVLPSGAHLGPGDRRARAREGGQHRSKLSRGHTAQRRQRSGLRRVALLARTMPLRKPVQTGAVCYAPAHFCPAPLRFSAWATSTALSLSLSPRFSKAAQLAMFFAGARRVATGRAFAGAATLGAVAASTFHAARAEPSLTELEKRMDSIESALICG